MNGIFIFCAILLIIETSIILFLCYKVGNQRNKKLNKDIDSILQSINHVISLVKNHENNTELLGSNIKLRLSQTSRYIKEGVKVSEKTMLGRIGQMENTLITELEKSSRGIQNEIQQAHTSLNNSFKGKFGEMKMDLLEVQKEVREYKNEILRTQAQSFSSIEKKMQTIQKEEHIFIQKEFQEEKKLFADLQVFINGEFQSEENTVSNMNASVQGMSSILNQHLASLKPLEKSLKRIEELYNKLATLDQDILKQELSLNGMVEKHVQILEYTKELSKTSKDIFDLMKLVLMKSIAERIKPVKKK